MKKLSFLLTLPTQAIASVMLAVLTFGFMATVTSCHNSLTGTDSQALSVLSEIVTHKIHVHFNVKNGGNGLVMSQGEVASEGGIFYNTGGSPFASNFTITFRAPIRDSYVKIHWSGKDGLGHWTYLSARLNLIFWTSNYDILIDYNGRGKVYTEGLEEVSVWK